MQVEKCIKYGSKTESRLIKTINQLCGVMYLFKKTRTLKQILLTFITTFAKQTNSFFKSDFLYLSKQFGFKCGTISSPLPGSQQLAADIRYLEIRVNQKETTNSVRGA